VYDQHGEEGLKRHAQGQDPNANFGGFNHDDIFNQFFGGGGGRRGSGGQQHFQFNFGGGGGGQHRGHH